MVHAAVVAIRGIWRRMKLKRHAHQIFGVCLLIAALFRSTSMLTTLYFAGFLGGLVYSFTIRWTWFIMLTISVVGLAGDCIVAKWPMFEADFWFQLVGLRLSVVNILIDSSIFCSTAFLLYMQRHVPKLRVRPMLRREVSGVRMLAFVLTRFPALQAFVVKLNLHETIHGLFAFFAEILIGLCLFITAISSRGVFGALFYLLSLGRLTIWTFWTYRPIQSVMSNTTIAPHSTVASGEVCSQDKSDTQETGNPNVETRSPIPVSIDPNATPVDAHLPKESDVGQLPDTQLKLPHHPLLSKIMVQGLLFYTGFVLILFHIYQYPVLRSFEIVQTLGNHAAFFVMPGTTENWLGYVSLLAQMGLFLSLSKMLSFFDSYQVEPLATANIIPVVVHVLRHELVAAVVAMFWAISYPSYASLGLFSLALLTLATHVLHLPTFPVQSYLLSLTALYAVFYGLVEYILLLPALRDLVPNQFTQLLYNEIDLAIQNTALIMLMLCQRARLRYPKFPTTEAPPIEDGVTAPPTISFLSDELNAYYLQVCLWCIDAKGVLICHVDTMVLFTIYVVVLSTSVNLFQTGSLILATYLSLFKQHRRRLWRLLLLYTLAVCLTLYTWNISCPPSSPLYELIGLTCYREVKSDTVTTTIPTMTPTPLPTPITLETTTTISPATIIATTTIAPTPFPTITRGIPSTTPNLDIGTLDGFNNLLASNSNTHNPSIVPEIDTSVKLASLWSSPLFNAQLLLIGQVIIQLIIYEKKWHKKSIGKRNELNPLYYLSQFIYEMDRIYRIGGVLLNYFILLILSFNWEIYQNHVTCIGLIQFILFFLLIDSHIKNLIDFPRGTKKYNKLWRFVLIIQLLILLLRYLFQFDPISNIILNNWMISFYTMEDIGFEKLSSKTHLSHLFSYLFPTFLMASLAAWQISSIDKKILFYSFKYQNELNLIFYILSNSSFFIIGIVILYSTTNITIMGLFYYICCIYVIIKKNYRIIWYYLFSISLFHLLFNYIYQLNIPWFQLNITKETAIWIGIYKINEKNSLWKLNYFPLLIIILCSIQRSSTFILLKLNNSILPLNNYIKPYLTQDTFITILLLLLLITTFIHLNIISIFYMILIRSIMIINWNDIKIYKRYIRFLTFIFIIIPIIQYLLMIWFPIWFVSSTSTLPPWKWLDSSYQHWFFLSYHTKWSLLTDFMVLFVIYFIPPPIIEIEPISITSITSFQCFISNYSNSFLLVWVFITGCAQFGVACGIYLGWSIYMLFHLDRLDWQPILLNCLQSYNWFYLFILILYQFPWFKDTTSDCIVGTNHPLHGGVCLSIPLALGLYKMTSDQYELSTWLSIGIFIMITIQMQIFTSFSYRHVLEKHRTELIHCQKRGYALNDELAKIRIGQWRDLKQKKQAAIQRLKVIVSKLVNKVEEMMDIAMGLHYSLPPMAPQRPVILEKTQNSVTLSWLPPESKIHKIRSYRISRQIFPSMTLLGDFGDVVDIPATSTTAEIRGLRPGTSYQFKVAAVSRMGEGPFSVSSEPIATIPLDWGDACTAGWMKTNKTSDQQKSLSTYILTYFPWFATTTYAQRYVLVDTDSITLYKSELLALKHRRDILKKKKKQHFNGPPSYFFTNVKYLDLSQEQHQLDEMSPLLYCIELTIETKGSKIYLSLQPEESTQFDTWIKSLLFVVPPHALGSRLLAYRQANNLAIPEHIMAKLLTLPIPSSNGTSQSTPVIQEVKEPSTAHVVYLGLYRIFHGLQDCALIKESVAYEAESEILPSWIEFLNVLIHVVRSHTAILCYFSFICAFAFQGDLLNMIYVISMFSILLCENPRPHAAQWKWILKYSFFVVLIRYIFQLPIFCHQYTINHILYPSFQPYCPSIPYTRPISNPIQPLVLFGLYKFDGNANISIDSTFQGLQWNFLVICCILFHRREFQLRGFWILPKNKTIKWIEKKWLKKIIQTKKNFDILTFQNIYSFHTITSMESNETIEIERSVREDSNDSLDQEQFEIADYIAKKNQIQINQSINMDLTCHIERLLQNEPENIHLKLTPMVPSFDEDDESDDDDDEPIHQKKKSINPLEPRDSMEIENETQEIFSFIQPQFTKQQKTLVKKSRFQLWLGHHMPLWLEEYYEKLLPRPPNNWDKDIQCAVHGTKPGRDYGLIGFGCHIFIIFYIIFFFHQFGEPMGSTGLFSLSSTFRDSLLSGYMVGQIFFHIVLVIWDRVSYVYNSLYSKLLSHYFTLVMVHLMVWIVFPYHTGIYFQSSPFLILLYLLECTVMIVSALQLRYGYLVFRGNPFSLSQADTFSKTLFRIYMAIPFAFEVRTLLDYICSTTALDMQLWLVLEGIGAHLYLVKLQMEGRIEGSYVLQGNQRQPLGAKFKTAGVYFIALMICLLAPMVMFSTANPTTVHNPILHATITFGLLQPDGTFQQFYNSEENESPISTKINIQNKETYIQQVSFMEFSNDIWSSSPPLRRRLMQRLNSTTGIQWRMTITLKRAAPDGQQIVTYDMVQSITPSQRIQLTRMMDVTLTAEFTYDSLNSAVLTIPNMYPPVLNVPAATLPSARTSYYNRNIQIRRSTESSGSYWTLSSLDSTAYLNASGSINNSTTVSCEVQGFCFFIVSDDIVAGLKTLGIGTYGITATYVFVIFTIGGYVKNALRGSVTDVLYKELPNPDDLMDLVEGIYIARKEEYIGHLKDETRLFETLIRVLRSPETLLKVTGPNIIHIPNSKQKID